MASKRVVTRKGALGIIVGSIQGIRSGAQDIIGAVFNNGEQGYIHGRRKKKDQEPPGVPDITLTVLSDTQIQIQGTMPSDLDVTFTALRVAVGTTYPPADNSSGIELFSQNIGPGETFTHVHNLLSPSTTYSYRLFVFDDADLFNSATAQATTQASSTAIIVPTYKLHVKPNYYVQSDGIAAGYRVVWVDHRSPTTNVMPNGDVRTIASPNAVHPSAVLKSWVWWLAWEMLVDPTWDPSRQGNWGTFTPNCHNSANDVGNSIHGGIGWGFGAGTSSVQTDYIGGNLYQHIQNDFTNFPSGNNLVQANLSKGVWHSVLMELTMGRIDGSVSAAGHPFSGHGRIRTWLDGSDTPVDTGPTNTLQKAVKNDDPNSPLNGQTFVQTLMDCWSGFYSGFADSMELIISTTAVRIGRSLSECLADQPVKVGDRVANLYDGSGTNLGPSFYETLTGAQSRTNQTFLLPPSLGG